MSKKLLLIIIVFILIILGLVFGITIHNKDKEKEEIPTGATTEVIGTTLDEDGLEAEGFQEENTDFVASNSKIDENDFVVGAKSTSPVYYSQVDSRWKNHMYSSIGDKSQTIGNSGCGPTSAAMIVSTIKGSILPSKMGDLFVKYGYRTANSGTYHSAFEWVGKYFDLTWGRAYSTDSMVNYLKKGYIAVCGCKKGLFTNGGHFIAIMGIDGDTLKVYDPYLYSGKFTTSARKPANVKVSGNVAYVSVSSFKKYGNAISWFVYKADNVKPEPTPTPTPEPTPTPSSKSYKAKVTAKAGLRIRKGASTSYKQVGSYKYNTIITITETKNGWGKTNKGWICLTYTKKVSNTSTNTNTNKSTSKYSLGRYVTTANLNVRTGPSTSYKIKKVYRKGTVFDTYQIKGNWAKTPSGWVCLTYAKLKYRY